MTGDEDMGGSMVPDATQMQPVDNTVLTSKTPIFKWDPVHLEGVDLFYRIQIFDQTGYRVFKSNRVKDLLSITVPNNVLTPGETYTWLIDVCDIDNWEILENRANSATLSFTMADTPAHANIPAMKIDGWRAVAYHTSDYDATECWIEVIDHDGVAYDGSSHQVSVTYNGETHTLGFSRTVSPISGAYEYWGNAPAPAGDYVFTVIDPDDNTGTLTDTLIVDILPSPDESTFAVNINGTTPTFTWDTVPGAVRYRVRIYNIDGSTAWNGYPETLPTPSCTVPPGVLQPNTPYNYRIEAWDGHSGLDIDNVSKSPASNSNNPTFQTGEETPQPFVDPDAHGAYAWDNIMTGPFLSFSTKIHDAQGVPANIKSVKVIFPDATEIPLYLDYTESSTCGIYINDSFALPIAPGNYTILVEDLDNNISSHTDFLDVNHIGYPSEESITTVFNDTQGDFTWDSVQDAAFYRLEIYDMDFNRLYAFATTTNAYHVPGSAMPSIDLNDFGAFVTHSRKAGTSNDTFWLEFEVMVNNLDGVPDNISTVRVVYPDETTTRDLRLDSGVEPGAIQGVYSFYETYNTSQEIQAGTYLFTVTDTAGKTATITDSLDIEPLPIPANYTPANGASVSSTTPVVSYNDSRGPGSGNNYNRYEGDIFAQIRLEYRSDGTLYAQAYVNRSDTSDESIFPNLFSHTFATPISLDTDYRLSINFEDKKFIFSCDGETTVYEITTPIYVPYGEHRQLRSRLYLNSGETGYLKTQFDDVYIGYPSGDINFDKTAGVLDAILGLRALTEQNTVETIYIEADLNKDNKIGVEETLYSLQIGSAVRRPAFPLQGYVGVTIQHGYPDSYALAVSTSIPFSSSRATGPNITNVWQAHETHSLVDLSARPVAGDTYKITILYEDGSSQEKKFVVENINDTFAAIQYPINNSIISTSSYTITPEFTWLETPGIVSSFIMVAEIKDQEENWIWSAALPANTHSAIYNFDNLATANLIPEKTYMLLIHTYDADGHQATTTSLFSVVSVP